jgi:hypothetical protein
MAEQMTARRTATQPQQPPCYVTVLDVLDSFLSRCRMILSRGGQVTTRLLAIKCGR